MTRSLVFLLSALLVTPASGQLVCGDRGDIIDALEHGSQEHPTDFGVSDTGALIELFETQDGNTWTLLMTIPGDVTCLMATGVDWQHIPRWKPQPEIWEH